MDVATFDYNKVPVSDKAFEDEQMSETKELDMFDEDKFEQQGQVLFLKDDMKSRLGEAIYNLRQDTEEAFSECIAGGVAPVDVMEVCCEADSLLVTMVEKNGGRGIRLGLFNGFDLLTDAGLQKALQAVREHRPKVLWISMPCGATSPIQHLNELTPEAKKKSMQRRARSRRLVKNGVKVMNEQVYLGGEVLQEWPFPNDAWKQREIREFWHSLQSIGREETIRLDGCAFGLRCEQGMMKKPWMLRCSKPGLFTALNRRCNGRHEHVPTLGVRARRSALYTPSLCRLAARCVMQMDEVQAFGAVEVRPDHDALRAMTTQELEKLAAAVVKLHRLCGHPSNRALMKTLAARGADGKTLAMAENLKCIECEENKMTVSGPIVSLHKEETLWATVQIDTFTFRHRDRVHHFLLCLDEASGFSVVQEIMDHHEEEHENLSTQVFLEVLEQSWIQYFGFPARIRLDQEGAFRGRDFVSWAEERGIEVIHTPAEHHESTGDVERAVGELRKKMMAHLRNEDLHPRRAAWSMCAGHNHVARVGGFSPAQWAFGRDVPDPDNMAALSSQADPNHEMSDNLQLRLRAENRYRELQSKAKISRALNSKVQKTTQFLPGDLVYYKRFKVPSDFAANMDLDIPNMKVSRWYGPGRVLACETRLEDDGVTRAAANVVWIVTQGRLKKIHSSQLRHASERERCIAEATSAPTMPWTFSSLSRTLGQGQYEDLTSQRPLPQDRGRSATPVRGRGRSRSRARQGEESTTTPMPPDQLTSPTTPFTGQPASAQLQPSLSPPQAISTTNEGGEPLSVIGRDEEELVPYTPIPGSRDYPLSDYEDEEELEIDRLLGEPTYLPLKRLPSREAPDDFVRARRRREQGPHDDGADAGGAASSSFALWCQDVAHDFVLGVTIPIPETEVEWKKILINPSKFISKSVLKGAEVSWHKLSATQRKAMSEAKQLEVDQWIVRKVVEKFRGHIPTDRLMKTRWVLTFKAIEGDEKNVKAKARIATQTLVIWRPALQL